MKSRFLLILMISLAFGCGKNLNIDPIIDLPPLGIRVNNSSTRNFEKVTFTSSANVEINYGAISSNSISAYNFFGEITQCEFINNLEIKVDNEVFGIAQSFPDCPALELGERYSARFEIISIEEKMLSIEFITE